MSLAAPEFVGALPRVLEEDHSPVLDLSPALKKYSTGSGQMGAAVVTEHHADETLCRAALDHIARGFDHVAMVSELLHEALDTLLTGDPVSKQRMTAWLHAALGVAFSTLEPVEAVRHLDAALDRYEDDETCRRSWAWPCAFLLERLAYCALRLGDAALCTSIFLKLAVLDVRLFLSSSGVAVAAQRDATALLTCGSLHDAIQTAALRGFDTANFGESRYLRKDSSEVRPAESAAHLGVIEWSAWFDVGQIFVLEESTSVNITVEVRLKASSPEPLHIEYFELSFRPKDIFRHTLVATAKDIIRVGAAHTAEDGLIPGVVYSWRLATALLVMRCGTVTVDTLTLRLAGSTMLQATSIPVSATRGTLCETSTWRRGCYVTLDIKHERPGVTLTLDGPRLSLAGEPSFVTVKLASTRILPDQIVVVDLLSNTVKRDYLDLTFDVEDQSSCTREGSGRFVYYAGRISAQSEVYRVGFWVTCHNQGTVSCKVTVTYKASLRCNEKIDDDPETGRDSTSVVHELSVLAPFLASFQMHRPIAQRSAPSCSHCEWLSATVPKRNVFQCVSGGCVTLRCNLRSSQQTSIAIRAVYYRHTSSGQKPELVYPLDGGPGQVARLIQHEVFTVQFNSPQLAGSVSERKNLGCLLVQWSTMLEDDINLQIIETHLDCPDVEIIQPAFSCKIDMPSRIYLGHPFVLRYHVISIVPCPPSLHVRGSGGLSPWGGKNRCKLDLLSQEKVRLDTVHLALLIGKNELPNLRLDTRCDNAFAHNRIIAFVQP